MKMKKSIHIISIIGLILLVIFTFVSRSVYNKNLPQVTANKISSGLVPLTWETTGALNYPHEVVLKSEGAWTISEILVKDGDAVNEDDLLCLFDMQDFDIEQQALALDILRLQNAIAALDDWRPQTAEERRSKSHQQAELFASLALAEARRDYALSQTPPQDGLRAPCPGVVYGLTAKPGDTLLRGDALLSLLSDETPQLTFFLPPKEGESFGPGVLVQALLETVQRDSGGKEVFVRQTVTGRVISGVLHGGQWECRATLKAFEGQPVAGQEVSLQVSQPGKVQNFVVPLGCLFDKENNKVLYVINSRPGLFGEENYISATSVSVLYDNGEFASLDSEGLYLTMALASDPSQNVNEGDVVWVRDSD